MERRVLQTVSKSSPAWMPHEYVRVALPLKTSKVRAPQSTLNTFVQRREEQGDPGLYNRPHLRRILGTECEVLCKFVSAIPLLNMISSVLGVPVCCEFSGAGPDDGAGFSRVTLGVCGFRVLVTEGVDVRGISVGCKVRGQGLISFRECP